MLTDIRLGLRRLWKDRTFAAASATTLAVCIGANVALFSIVDSVLLRPLPWPGAERIVLLANQYPGAGIGVNSSSGVPDYFDRLRETDVFEAQALYRWASVGIDQGGSPARAVVMNVTPSFFRVLGVNAALGRTFTEDEGEVGSADRAVLSHGLWQSAFGGDPHVVGREMRVDDRPVTIVGVMPAAFSYLDGDEQVRLWRPLTFTDEQKSDDRRHSNNWEHIGRLKPDATIERARQQIDALNARNMERFPQYSELLRNARFHTTVTRLHDHVVRDVKPTLYLLFGGAVFVLLIGSVNVASLVLVRASARRRELATRLAIGAGRWQVGRQLVTEQLLLAGLSAAGGVTIGAAALRALTASGMLQLPRAREIHVDWLVGLGAFGAAAAIGLLLALIPIASLTRINLAAALADGSRTATGSRRARVIRRAFVVVQVAFAFVLLIGAGLLLTSFGRLLAVDPGFDPDRVLTAEVSLPGSRYADGTSRIGFVNDALLRLRALPGVTGAGVTDTIPFGSNLSDNVIFAEGYQMRPGESVISPSQVVVSAGYFEAMGATLVRGRFFDGRDTSAGAKTIIVDETLARRFWGGRDPVGRRMYEPTDINDLMAITDKTVFLTVVGVVRDLKLKNLVEGSGEVGAYFYPFDQRPRGTMTFAVRTSADPASLAGPVRSVIGALDRELPVYGVRTMRDRFDRSLANRRAPMFVAAAFAAVALLLSAIGVYGVLAYLVAQRTREFGIRMALGSSADGVCGLVLKEGLVLIGVGVAVGAAGVVALKRTLDSLAYGVTAADPTVLAAVVAVLMGVAMAASSIPARRAARIDPAAAISR